MDGGGIAGSSGAGDAGVASAGAGDAVVAAVPAITSASDSRTWSKSALMESNASTMAGSKCAPPPARMISQAFSCEKAAVWTRALVNQRTNRIAADGGVPLHDLELFGSQLAGLEQDGVGHTVGADA